MKLLLVLGMTVAFFGGCSYLNKQFGWQDDNPAEELIEQVIEDQIGVDVDLTP